MSGVCQKYIIGKYQSNEWVQSWSCAFSNVTLKQRMEWKNLSCEEVVSTKERHAIIDKPQGKLANFSPLNVASSFSMNIL